MPYILSPIIEEDFEGLWNEGPAYERKNLYRIQSDKLPAVNYDEHILRPHSLPHAEGSKHTQESGKTIDNYFEKSLDCFYGECLLLKFKDPKFVLVSEGSNLFHWQISESELKQKLYSFVGENYQLKKIAITIDDHFLPRNSKNLHDPNYVVTLSEEAAIFLISYGGFNAFLTSWKSSDFMPGKRERPIHDILFQKAIIFECLTFVGVPEGKYFFNGFPLPLKNSSESPCCPVFLNWNEI
jgi:kynurenine formamidase